MNPENQEPVEEKKIEVTEPDNQPKPAIFGESNNEAAASAASLDDGDPFDNSISDSSSSQPISDTPSPVTDDPVASNTSSLDQAVASLPTNNEPSPSAGPVVAGGDVSPSSADHSDLAAKPKRKKGWLWALIAVLVIIILATLWFFLMYLPNRPSAVYNSSLTNTGKAVDMLIDYSKTAQPENFKNSTVTGSATVNGKNYKFTGGLNGSYNLDGSSNTTLNVDSETEGNTNSHLKATFDLRTLKDASQTYPDIYLRATGISSLLDQVGASQFDSYDGKWIEISHSFVSKYAAEATGQAESDQKQPTKDQIYDAVDKVQAVNKEYFFTPNSSKAVLVQKQYIGPETKYGRDTYHYLMGYNKDNLASYVKAVGQALDSSSLNDFWQKNYQKSISSQVDIDNAVKQINKLDGSYTFDMWADRDTKLIEAVQFKDKQHPDNSVTIAQTYSGGHVYPFRVDVVGNQDGDKGSFTLELTLDGDKHQTDVSFDYNDDNHGNKTSAQGDLKFTSSNNSTKVDRPSGSTPIEKLLGMPVVGDSSQSSSADKSGSSSKAPSPAVSSLQTEADYAKIQEDASRLLGGVAEYTMNNNGKQPKYAVQMGSTVQLCDNSGCTGTKPVSLKMASSEKVVVAQAAPRASDQMVLAPGMKCDGSRLVQASSRDVAVSYYLGKTLTCQQG